MPYADRVSILSTILAFEAFEAAIAAQATTTPADHVIVSLDPSKPKESLCGPDVAISFWAEDARFKVIMHTMKLIEFIGSSDSSGFTILKAIHDSSSIWFRSTPQRNLHDFYSWSGRLRARSDSHLVLWCR
jgi:hypothetical protein